MRLAPLTALFALLVACSSDKVAGTGSQTGNSVVAGRLLRADATTPDSGDSVVLKPAGWVGDSLDAAPRVVRTDSLGWYRFEDVAPGVWFAESRDHRSGWGRTFRVVEGRDTILPDAVPVGFGTLIVEVHLSDELKRGRMFVLGSSNAYSLLPNPPSAREIFVTVPELSAGAHTLVVRSASGEFLQQAIVKARSGETDSVKAATWSTSRTEPAEDEPADDDD